MWFVGTAWAQEHPAGDHGAHGAIPSGPSAGQVAEEPAGFVLFDEIRSMIVSGRPMPRGTVHAMAHGMAYLQNLGLDDYTIENAGESTSAGVALPELQHTWVMGYGYDRSGVFEGLAMLNLEPLFVGDDGVPELGQEGEGLVDAQHAHLLVHEAMIGLHPIPGARGLEDPFDLVLFFGQGSATIGPPIFMHRASAPGPTVPRKHHKGENPHETLPVIGLTGRAGGTWLDVSVFDATELTPEDSRFVPHPGVPDSVAARLRQNLWEDRVEVQVSAERLVDLGSGEPDQAQVSASVYAWGRPGGYRLDLLLDQAWVIPFDDDDHHPPVSGSLVELALRSPSLRDVAWFRGEVTAREFDAELLDTDDPPPWTFVTLGGERVFVASRALGTMVGAFGEATLVGIPGELAPTYGRSRAVTLAVGLRAQGLWMLAGEH